MKEYELIPMSKITDQARELAVLWGEKLGYNWIGDKHKLASDIMNYAEEYAEQFKQHKWVSIQDHKKLPSHKDLVFVWDGHSRLPAIYYDNSSFCGFYEFTTFYDSHAFINDLYCKTKLNDENKINNVTHWQELPSPPKS